MGVKGKKAKGNAAEEYVAKKIRIVYNLNEDEVYRSPHSGNANRELGDIFVIKRLRETIFPFVIECKNHEAWDIRSIWPSLNKTVLSWFDQVKKECEGTDFSPLIVLTKSYYPYYVIIHEDHISELWDILKQRTYLKCKDGYFIIDLEDFLHIVKEKYGDRR